MTDTATRIPHDGSACPVSPGTRVRVWWAHGTVGNAIASQVNWSAHPHYAVTHYAVLEPDWAIEGPKLRDELRDLEIAARDVANGMTTLNIAQALPGPHARLISRIASAHTALSRIKGEEG